MKADFHRTFNKQFERLTNPQKQRAKAAVVLFLNEPEHPILRNHPLKGKWRGYRSISAGGDLRLHYRIIDSRRVIFVAVGSHSRLYK